MKILWISYLGSWTKPLISRLSEINEVTLIVPSKKECITKDGNLLIHNIRLTDKETECCMSISIFRKYEKIIRSFSPDIIHVHGTEKNLAQIQNYITDIPIVISIQGLLSGYIPFDNGYIKEETISPFRTLKNRCGRGGYLLMHKRFIKGSRNYEQDILEKGKYFFCRTNWDKAWISFTNSGAQIFQGEELLRDPFYRLSGCWNIENCNKHTIFMPSGFNPIKGLHLALKSIALLKKYYDDVKLIVPGLPIHIINYDGLKAFIQGEEYVNYCKNIIQENKLEDNVVLLPRLDAIGMANEMIKANVFLSPSSIDNSPNTVGEATMIGMPIVCTPVGGVTSFMHDEDNCLIAPAGDEYMIAYQIKRLFDNNDLASELGLSALQTAHTRHNTECGIKQYQTAYQKIVSIHRKLK